MNDFECPIVKSDSTCYWKDMWRKLDRMRHVWQLTDVSLVSMDKVTFMAHSPVLAASSNLFHDLLIRQSSESCEQTTRNLFLNNINSDVLKVTLDFIYGITPLTGQSFKKLQIGAKELGIVGAYEYCTKHLINMKATVPCIQAENVTNVNDSNSETMEDLTNCAYCSAELPYSLRGSQISKDITMTMIPVSSNQNGNEKLAEGSVSIVDWSLSMSESISDDQRTNGKAQNLKVYNSVYSSDPEHHSSELGVTDEIPCHDDVHSTAFTQMSLGDLTAGLRCPHIKGIMGEDNPMETFLVEDELVDNVLKEPRSPHDAESDFGDVSSASEEQKVGIVARMPLKKRKRLSPDIHELSTTASSDHNSNCDKNAEASHLPSLEVSNSILSKGIQHYDSSRQNFRVQICDSLSSGFLHCSSSKESLLLEMQMDEMKSLLSEPTGQKTVTESKNPTGMVCKDQEDVNPLFVRDLIPGYGSLLFPCISTVNQHYQLLNKSADSVSNSIFTTQCDISNTTVCSGSFHHLSNQQMHETSKESNIWHIPVSRSGIDVPVDFLSLRKLGLSESVSNIDSNSSYSQDQELALDSEGISNCCGTNAPCKSKDFSTEFANEVSSGTLINTLCTNSLENEEMFIFSASGQPQVTVPNSVIRSQPSETYPNTEDASFLLSRTADRALLREKLKSETSMIEQISCHSSCSGSKEENNQSILEKNSCCSICDKAFKSASQLSIHRRRFHLQYDTVSCSASDKHGAVHQCQYCQEFFKSSYKLQTHQLKVHCKGKLFSCKDCNFRSPRKKDVQAHMLSQHGFAPSGVKVYSCANCNYKCIDRNRFEEHEAKHTGITSHCCPLCNRAYTTKRGMRTHLKYHSEERPHKCSICGAGFKVTSKLSDHMKLIHLQKGVKPYKCGYCDHATALRGNCNQHIRKNHPGQPLLVIDKFASQRKCVKDYDYAGMAGDGIEEHQDLESARTRTRSNKISC